MLSKLPQEAVVISSVAEAHYGVTASVPWDFKRDAGKESHRFWDEWEEIHRISRMTWYIHQVSPTLSFIVNARTGLTFRQGDDLERSRSVDFAFFTTLSMNPTQEEMIVTYELHSCPLEVAPDYPEGSVNKNCSLSIDLSVVPRELFKTKTRASDGNQYLVINYKLLVKIEGARMVFAFECAGKEYGAVSAEY